MTTTKHVLFTNNSHRVRFSVLCVCRWFGREERASEIENRFSSYLHMVLYEGWLFGWFVGWLCVPPSSPPPPPPSFYSVQSIVCSSLLVSRWFHIWHRARAPRNKAHLSSLKLYKIIFRCRSCLVLVASFYVLSLPLCLSIDLSHSLVVFVILPFSYNCFTAYVHPYTRMPMLMPILNVCTPERLRYFDNKKWPNSFGKVRNSAAICVVLLQMNCYSHIPKSKVIFSYEKCG